MRSRRQAPGTVLARSRVDFRRVKCVRLSAGGDFLFSANQKSNTVTSFAVDKSTGALTSAGKPLASPMPVCTVAL